MKQTLYEIQTEYAELEMMHELDPENKEFEERLEELQGMMLQKVDNFAQFIKHLESVSEMNTAMAKSIEEHALQYKKKAQSKANLADRLKERMMSAMTQMNMDEVKGLMFKAKIQDYKGSVEFNESTLPDEYLKKEVKVDRASLRKDLLAGKQVKDCFLRKEKRLRIN